MIGQNAEETRQDSRAGAWLEQLARHRLARIDHRENNAGLLLGALLDRCGWQGDAGALLDALPSAMRALQAQDVLAVMGALGYRIESERYAGGEISTEHLPALFVPRRPQGWRTGVVLQGSGHYGVVWDDGRDRSRGPLPAREGRIYRFIRQTGASDGVEEAPRAPWLRQLYERFRPLLIHACGLSLLMQCFALAMPLFSMAVYDKVIGAHSPESLCPLAFGAALALLVEYVVRGQRVRIAGWIGARSGLLAAGAMFERLLFLPASLIEQASVSSQLARIRAFESIRDFITGPVFLTLLELPFLVFLILIIALLAGPVASVTLGVVLLQGALTFGLRRRWRSLGRDMAHQAAARQKILMDIIEQVTPIYGAGLSGRMLQRFRGVSRQAASAHHRFAFAASFVQHLAGFVTIVAGVVTIHWCLNRIWEGQMTGGGMVATMILTWRVLYPLQAVCGVLPQLEQMRGSLLQVAQLMSHTPEAHAGRDMPPERKLEGRVVLQSLGLRYGRKSDPVFMGLTAEIEPGEIVAVYGGNGSGKSSILRVLLGLYAPAVGSIRLDGVDHRQFDPRALRRQIAYLPQAPELIPGTVAENLRLHYPLAPEHKLRQALLWADAWDKVEALPGGLEAKLGAEAITPSAGLAARICLARLYLSEQPLVLCDELPAQLLNGSTAERFQRFLEDCRGKRTVFFVTHREDWLKSADKVFWFKPDGRVVVTRPKENVIKKEAA